MSRFVRCPAGSEHWGPAGAAGLALWSHWGHGAMLLQKRSVHSHQGGTWSVLGGALEPGEDPVAAALRETAEEAVVDLTGLMVHGLVPGPCPADHCGWTYTTVVASVSGEPAVSPHSWESESLQWTPRGELEAANAGSGGPELHAGLRRVLPAILAVVDGLQAQR
ncbi:MAG TPA: NUDIX hydrolase [Mycobacteriales bacterium]|jgi:8-oxo-dGTP pyrophosphatase MutT (NUDIX family)|nr:NUDIX hydrolase [Mycobacteriales bacterium]